MRIIIIITSIIIKFVYIMHSSSFQIISGDRTNPRTGCLKTFWMHEHYY